MNAETFARLEIPSAAAASDPDTLSAAPVVLPDSIDAQYLATLDSILDDCLLSMGQAVGMRRTLEYEAVGWLRNAFRPKFASAMEAFGDRWLTDRVNVTSVALMLGERAVRYAADEPSISVQAVKRAAADVERYCRLHSLRAAKAQRVTRVDSNPVVIAGYWCTPP